MDTDMVDIHAHILPGIDDGPETLEESLGLAEELALQGVHTVVTTPHWGRITKRTLSEIREIFLEIKEKLQENSVEINIFLGFELFLDLETLEEVKGEPEKFSLAGGNFILVEFPFEFLYPNWEVLLREIREAGLSPVIAHPERYGPVLRDYSLLSRMVAEGAILQVNAESLLGENGERARKTAMKCLQEGLCSVVASDAHGLRFRPPRLRKAYELISKKISPYSAQDFFEKNPGNLLQGVSG